MSQAMSKKGKAVQWREAKNILNIKSRSHAECGVVSCCKKTKLAERFTDAVRSWMNVDAESEIHAR